MKYLLLAALLLFNCAPAFAQDTRTDPIVIPHPVTGESGVWTPTWLQRIHLQTDAELQVCRKTETLRLEQLEERQLTITALEAANTELQSGVETLKTDAALSHQRVDAAERKARRRLVWGVTSTSAAVVALLVAALIGAL